MFGFDWDPAKAASNLRKHGIGFDLAATVFQYPLGKSIPDDDHGMLEDRWITMRQARNGRLLVVSHTYRRVGDDRTTIRIISARTATRGERRQFESGR